jgi:outer membrane protein assembly factor BamB
MVLVHADGAVYGIDADAGHPSWRRYVGFDAPGGMQLVQRKSSPHALLVDSTRRELVCVSAADGQLAWRQTLGSSTAAALLVLRNRVAAAMEDGRLLLVDLDSGQSLGYIKFPHRLTVAPGADARQRFFYQLADHSNLYIVSATSGECQEVVYLGHESGSIRVPPLSVGNYLLVAENQGATTSLLRVFTIDENGLNVRLVQSVPLEGHVHVQPQVTQSKTLLVITDRGTFYTFDIGSKGKKDPLTQVASRPSLDDRPLVRFAVARGAEFFVADNQLSKFDIQAAQGRLSPKWEENRDDLFVAPLEAVGDYLIHVRRKAGIPGVAVAAAKMSDGSIVWETHLAAPLAGDPIVAENGQTIVAATQAGGIYRLAASQLETSIIENGLDEYAAPDRLKTSDALSATNTQSAATDAGTAVFRFGDRQLISVQAAENGLQWRTLKPPAALSMGPITVGKTFLVGTQSGQVLLMDAVNGRPAAEPFQPRLESGIKVQWRKPAVTDSGDILIADNLQRLFRLREEPQPRPHLALKVEKELPESLATPVATSGGMAYAATATSHLMAFNVEDLEMAAEWNLAAPVVWGPFGVAGKVLAATATGTLVCLDGKQELWRTELPYGPLCGRPLTVGGRLVLAAKSGVVYSVAPDDGQSSQPTEVGQPLASGPILLGSELLLVGHDGVLLRVPAP